MNSHVAPFSSPDQRLRRTSRRRAPRPLSVIPADDVRARKTAPSEEVALHELIDDLRALIEMGLLVELPGEDGLRYALTEMGLAHDDDPDHAA